jgi:hypothetical protein
MNIQFQFFFKRRFFSKAYFMILSLEVNNWITEARRSESTELRPISMGGMLGVCG